VQSAARLSAGFFVSEKEDAMSRVNEFGDLIREYGVGATNYAFRYAEDFGREVEDVAADIAGGANFAQATLGHAVLNSDADTFDFSWESSDELNMFMDMLDGVSGNYDPSEDGYSARAEMTRAAQEDGNDVNLVGTITPDGEFVQTVEFNFG
jgi:hypothetical protein